MWNTDVNEHWIARFCSTALTLLDMMFEILDGAKGVEVVLVCLVVICEYRIEERILYRCVRGGLLLLLLVDVGSLLARLLIFVPIGYFQFVTQKQRFLLRHTHNSNSMISLFLKLLTNYKVTEFVIVFVKCCSQIQAGRCQALCSQYPVKASFFPVFPVFGEYLIVDNDVMASFLCQWSF